MAKNFASSHEAPQLRTSVPVHKKIKQGTSRSTLMMIAKDARLFANRSRAFSAAQQGPA